MNHEAIAKKLPLAVTILGIMGMALRWALYLVAMDEKYLLTANHPLELGVWILTAAALGLIVFSAWKLDGSNKYFDNFTASSTAAGGHVLAGFGMMATALTSEPLLANNLGLIWKVLGLLSGPCMLAAAVSRYQGKRPFFLLHIVPCLFLVFHIINHYQLWSGNPQIQDYVFTLFGSMALMFFSFYGAAFDVGSGRRRMHLGMGLAAVYLGLVSLPWAEDKLLYATGILWAISDLCTLYPKPRPNKTKEKPNEAA